MLSRSLLVLILALSLKCDGQVHRSLQRSPIHSTLLNKLSYEVELSRQNEMSSLEQRDEEIELERLEELVLNLVEPTRKKKRATPRVVPNPKSPPPPSNIVIIRTSISAAAVTTTSTTTTVISSTALASRSTLSVATSSVRATASTFVASSTTHALPPAPTGSNCNPGYTNAGGAAIYGPQQAIGIPMSPSPSTFVVKKSDGTLSLDGKPYRIVGPNIYWLGLDENVGIAYPTHQRIREAMAIAVAMGANTIRSITLGVSSVLSSSSSSPLTGLNRTGNPLSLWPAAGVVNGAAFGAIDYSIATAKAYGIRLIIPLTDDYKYYHGGKYDFLAFAGQSTVNGNLFYTNVPTISLFKSYISFLLNHVNVYTGVALKDEPTILAWETGNELGAYMLSEGAPPAAWTLDITNFIKSLSPNSLVSDGSNGLTNSQGVETTNAFTVPPIDLVTDHFYPAANYLIQKDSGLVSSASEKKNYFVGELDWTGMHGGDNLSSFYGIVEGMGGSGSMIWSVFGHDDQCCAFVQHNDGYSLYYPNGNPSSLSAQILLVVQHWYRMRGLMVPNSLPAVACPQLGLP